MNGSYNFLLHLLGFGMLVAAYVRGIVFERTLRREPDWTRRALIMKLMNSFGWLGPLSGVILLVTGFGNMYNRYLGSTEPHPVEGWIIGKLVLFAVFIIHGATFGRVLMKRRALLIQESAKNGPSLEAEKTVGGYNRGLAAFHVIQGGLLLWMTFMAAFGSSKHPGVF